MAVEDLDKDLDKDLDEEISWSSSLQYDVSMLHHGNCSAFSRHIGKIVAVATDHVPPPASAYERPGTGGSNGAGGP